MRSLPKDFSYEIERQVVASMTADQWGNPTPAQVLATPVLLQLFEQCAAEGILPYLNSDELILGAEVVLQHRRPTPPGFTLHVKTRLLRVSANKLTFDLEAWDGMDVVATGTLTSAVVSRSSFETRFAEKFRIAEDLAKDVPHARP